jgi:hypothetical protein
LTRRARVAALQRIVAAAMPYMVDAQQKTAR